jgi:hypothetical protein
MDIRNSLLATLLAGTLLVGCNTIRGTQTRTQAPPAGPVQADTTAPGVIAAGTTFAVRTNQDIKSDQAGQTFSAEIAQDIQNRSGETLVPKGSAAELVILETNSGGVTGTRSVALGLRSVTVNGKKHTVTTAENEQRGAEGIGQNRRTAEMVGGGAALGTLIGAIAGGGKGAAVGAAVGAAGGAGSISFSRSRVPPTASRPVWRLAQPARRLRLARAT